MKSVRALLGTYVVVDAAGPDDDVALAAMDAAFAAIDTVQRLMSAFEPDSDVSKINLRAHLEPVTVHPWTAQVLRLAAQIHSDSDGLFDIGIAPRLAHWDMLPHCDLDYPDSTAANLRVEGLAVSCMASTRIDLGGIAKGYAVDRAVEAALQAGAHSVLVNAGGDLRIAGDIEEPVYVRDPKRPVHTVLAGKLQNGAIATSGTYYSARPWGDASVSAIVEPSTRSPLLSEASYSVIAPRCAVADALTKVLALSGDSHHPALSRHHAQALVLSPS